MPCTPQRRPPLARDAPWGALLSTKSRCVALFDAVVRIEDRRVNDRPEPLTGGVRGIRRNQRFDEDLIPVQHLRHARRLVRAEAGRIQYLPARVSQSSRPSSVEMSSSWRPLLRTARRPPSRWNAGTPVFRVNILENAPETAGLSADPSVEGVRYCRHRKGLGDTVTRGGHRAAAGVGRRRRRRARAADAARRGRAAPPGSGDTCAASGAATPCRPPRW